MPAHLEDLSQSALPKHLDLLVLHEFLQPLSGSLLPLRQCGGRDRSAVGRSVAAACRRRSSRHSTTGTSAGDGLVQEEAHLAGPELDAVRSLPLAEP
tara:strand:+ start:414 stop:704 length:291 start_codon:yes stop_codon:yes gene_type:complete